MVSASNDMSPMPRAARAPHTAKIPEVCPHCGGRALTRRGTRTKKFEIVQLWRCASCKRVFTPAPLALRNKTFALRIILEALTTYSLGYSVPETLARLKAKRGRIIAPSTLTHWIFEHKELLSYLRLRDAGRHRYPPTETIRTIKLYHRQIYSYALHRPKLDRLRSGALDDKRRGDLRFSAVADFLEAVPRTCPHELFQAEHASGRASQAHPAFADNSRIIINRKENIATRIAALVIPTVGDNHRRHEMLQQFMLANDSVTLAVEIPIWLREDDIVALEKKHARCNKLVEEEHRRTQVVEARPARLHDQCRGLSDFERASIGMRRRVDDQQLVVLGTRERCPRRVEGFNVDWRKTVLLPQLVPLEDRVLLRIEISNPYLEACVRDHGTEGAGKRAFAGATLLRHEPDDDGLIWHAP